MSEETSVPVELGDSEDLEVRLGLHLSDAEMTEDEILDSTVEIPMRLSSSRSVVHEDFEDGQYTGIKTQMSVPPRVIEEDGRKFLRITGSPGDKQSIPASFTHRTRSTVTFTSHYSSMPLTTPENMRQTYQADARIGPPCPDGCSFFEMYQGAPGGESHYGAQNGSGPSARFIVVKGRAKFETRYNNEKRVDVYDLGVDANQWHTYKLEAVWSHSPRVGSFEVYVDGRLKHTIRGRDVNMGPLTNRIPMVKFGLYGDHVTGRCDIDNIHVGPTDGPLPDVPPIRPPIQPPIERVTRATNCGGAAYTSTDGTVYAADKGFYGGRKELMENPIAGTEDVPLYQSWRYGTLFRYSAPFPNGKYLITLDLAEHLHTEPGKRVFDIDVEGEPVITRLDVFAKVGAKTAYRVQIPVTVTDQALAVAFEATTGNAMVSAIKVAPV